jgi:hypothetical protein
VCGGHGRDDGFDLLLDAIRGDSPGGRRQHEVVDPACVRCERRPKFIRPARHADGVDHVVADRPDGRPCVTAANGVGDCVSLRGPAMEVEQVTVDA